MPLHHNWSRPPAAPTPRIPNGDGDTTGHGQALSVDSKKKELIGETPGYKNNGRDWQPQGQPVRVAVHDFPDPAIPKAVPYGIYDLSANTGWVTVGSDGDTAAFAVATLRSWWAQVGQVAYPTS